ncbi:MAG: hypothetical protein K2R93_03790 [Gemmatimonadaceae bacterium]|nr:hypothetical protein [Gemmatimonadaceae bacterium]
MNRAREQSVAHAVAERVASGGSERYWSLQDFSDLDADGAVAAALSRLARRGALQRVRRGVYFAGRMTSFGASRPDPTLAVAAALRHRGVEAVPSGLAEFNRLGLTTQMSAAITLAAPKRVRTKAYRGIAVHVVSRPLAAQAGITSPERGALDALRRLRRVPDTTPAAIVGRLKLLLSSGRLNVTRLTQFAAAEPPRVRALLGAICEEVLRARPTGTRTDAGRPKEAVDGSSGSTTGEIRRALDELRDGLHPLTTYDVPEDLGLRHARTWRLRGRKEQAGKPALDR